ncbi:MAG: hypothetical protein ACRDQZ_04400, partial [Mycobacteriales bacterium]
MPADHRGHGRYAAPVYRRELPHPSGRAQLTVASPAPISEAPGGGFSLLLNTGRTVDHLRPNQTGRVGIPEDMAFAASVEVNPVAARRLRMHSIAPVRGGRPGAVDGLAVSVTVSEGEAFILFHYDEQCVYVHTLAELDPSPGRDGHVAATPQPRSSTALRDRGPKATPSGLPFPRTGFNDVDLVAAAPSKVVARRSRSVASGSTRLRHDGRPNVATRVGREENTPVLRLERGDHERHVVVDGVDRIGDNGIDARRAQPADGRFDFGPLDTTPTGDALEHHRVTLSKQMVDENLLEPVAGETESLQVLPGGRRVARVLERPHERIPGECDGAELLSECPSERRLAAALRTADRDHKHGKTCSSEGPSRAAQSLKKQPNDGSRDWQIPECAK